MDKEHQSAIPSENNITQSPQPTMTNDATISPAQTTQTSQPDSSGNQPDDPVAINGKKIKFWKKFSIIIGLLSLLSYIAILIVANIVAHESQSGWVFFMIFGLYWQRILFILVVLSIFSLTRIITLSIKRHQHFPKDYAVAVVGLALVFSPYAVSGILSLFRITWNDTGGVSVKVKSKDPYYINGDYSSGGVCLAGNRTSNDLKNVNIDDHYSYITNDTERELFATEVYVREISEEILCQVGKFYEDNGRFPNEDEIQGFASEADNDDVRAGVYDIKLDTGMAPNTRDFTILFDKNCTNTKTDIGNISILTPLYGKGKDGRYCVRNDIDTIIKNLNTTQEDSEES